MDGRAVAWVAYLPLPGLALIPRLAAPGSRLARYHAWQGGVLVGLVYAIVVPLGIVASAGGGRLLLAVVGALAAITLAAGLAATVVGIASASRGRFVRIRPVWDLLALLGR
ncbi:MAG TPA: hypothetical protein VI796_03785 [Candidatus Thermoplasmatota archaeon]|nr:hypothetical protein [Candidatus Thermoplasmatota archaeon]